jgi:hypothetical protein
LESSLLNVPSVGSAVETGDAKNNEGMKKISMDEICVNDEKKMAESGKKRRRVEDEEIVDENENQLIGGRKEKWLYHLGFLRDHFEEKRDEKDDIFYICGWNGQISCLKLIKLSSITVVSANRPPSPCCESQPPFCAEDSFALHQQYEISILGYITSPLCAISVATCSPSSHVLARNDSSVCEEEKDLLFAGFHGRDFLVFNHTQNTLVALCDTGGGNCVTDFGLGLERSVCGNESMLV